MLIIGFNPGHDGAIAMGGWYRHGYALHAHLGAGYHGAQDGFEQPMRLGGEEVKFFSSSHIRSHILMGPGMAPRDDGPLRAVLVWEGAEGSFYLLDERFAVVSEIPVLSYPGGR